VTPLVRRGLLLGLSGVSLYLLAPTLIEVFSSAPQLADIRPAWFVPMLVLEAGSLACMAYLQRICLGAPHFAPVLWSQLAANAFARVVPGGGAAGAALQYSMLVQAGEAGGRAASALTAANLLTFATLLALPVLALPAILLGVPVDGGLEAAAAIGAGAFVLLGAAGSLLLATTSPLVWIAEVVQAALLRLRRLRGRPAPGPDPLADLPARVVAERDFVLGTVGARWRLALLASVGRWMLDFGVLLTALAAVGAEPSPSLVLLAYAGAQLLALIPLTPGGLGFVEAGLTGLLALAGVGAANATLATLAYRLVSYWLPLPVGATAAVVHRRRHVGAAAG